MGVFEEELEHCSTGLGAKSLGCEWVFSVIFQAVVVHFEGDNNSSISGLWETCHHVTLETEV